VEDAELRTAKAEQRLALALHEKCDLKLRVTQLHAEVGLLVLWCTACPASPPPCPASLLRRTGLGGSGAHPIEPVELPPAVRYRRMRYRRMRCAVVHCCGSLLRRIAVLRRRASRRVALHAAALWHAGRGIAVAAQHGRFAWQADGR
jgi:hypothetical protein